MARRNAGRSARKPAVRACDQARRCGVALWQLFGILSAKLGRPVLFVDGHHTTGGTREIQNYEVGLKWDIRPRLALTSAIYRLDRTNTRRRTRTTRMRSSRRAASEERIRIRPHRQRCRDGRSPAAIVSECPHHVDTTAAPAGRLVAQVPHDSFSSGTDTNSLADCCWARFDSAFGYVCGVDNTVVLPGYLKADGAVFYTFNEHWRLQANIENLTNKRYFINADNNTNISPGCASLGIKIGLVASF